MTKDIMRGGVQKTIPEPGCSSAQCRSWRQGEREIRKAGLEGSRKTKENDQKISLSNLLRKTLLRKQQNKESIREKFGP